MNVFRFVVLKIYQLQHERNNEPYKIDLLNVNDMSTFGISVHIL